MLGAGGQALRTHEQEQPVRERLLGKIPDARSIRAQTAVGITRSNVVKHGAEMTYEVPLAIGDALWEVLVVQLAALLDRLTVRKVIAFIPVVILIGGLLSQHSDSTGADAGRAISSPISISSRCCSWSAYSVASRRSCSSSSRPRSGSPPLAGSLVGRMQRRDARHRRQRGGSSETSPQPDQSEDDRAYGSCVGPGRAGLILPVHLLRDHRAWTCQARCAWTSLTDTASARL